MDYTPIVVREKNLSTQDVVSLIEDYKDGPDVISNSIISVVFEMLSDKTINKF